MKLKDYIHKLQQKPVRERERIAVIATAIGFAILLVIWIVSFNEMNKQSQPPVDQTSANLNDLKNNFQQGKDSIQNMMQQLPNQAGAAGATGVDSGNGTQNLGTDNSADATLPGPSDNSNSGNSPQDSNNSPAAGINNNSAAQNNQNQNKDSVPQLP